ncbi:hypothetical protein [Puerhibacterium puerhi]|uniref:hypothetical protein n=1 Tax=Puerhibacterium puerhi TaxID=2692623 RepID=UPI0013569CDB|nr:hypothetical protein [Puerhibacterium puerhi]
MIEDEIAQETDQLVRTAFMALGQLRERSARNQAARSAAQFQEVARQDAQVRENTRLVHERVQRDGFWRAASPAAIADVARYTAAVARHDVRGREADAIVAEQLHSRYGINLAAIRLAHPESEEARRQALVDALDDAMAVRRQDALAREDLAASAQLDERADDKEEVADPSAAADASEAQELRDDAREHHAEADRISADASSADAPPPYTRASEHELKAVPDAAAEARRTSATNFPKSANAVLRDSRRGSAPRARTILRRSGARERSPELTR